jgi:hypothetical protein
MDRAYAFTISYVKLRRCLLVCQEQDTSWFKRFTDTDRRLCFRDAENGTNCSDATDLAGGVALEKRIDHGSLVKRDVSPASHTSS